jgi:hypothetical protein
MNEGGKDIPDAATSPSRDYTAIVALPMAHLLKEMTQGSGDGTGGLESEDGTGELECLGARDW